MDRTREHLAEALGQVAGQIVLTRTGGVVTLAFARPDKHNAISYAMWQALSRVMPVLAADEGCDVVVVRGTPGGPFSSGADIGEFSTLRAGPDGARRYGEAVEAGEQALIGFPKPTVALIEGFAIGGGTQVALACDLRVCGTGSRFGIPPAKLGIVYALGSTARLVETVGPAWARWILLTGDLVDASTALRIGLVHEVVGTGEVADRAYALAAGLASRARVSLVGGKQLVARLARGEREEDDAVRELYHQSWGSEEYAEGVASFLDKRAPDFPAARRRRSAPPRS